MKERDREIEELRTQIEELQKCLKQTLHIAIEAQENAKRVSQSVKTAQEGVDFTLKFAKNTHNLALRIEKNLAERIRNPIKVSIRKIKEKFFISKIDQEDNTQIDRESAKTVELVSENTITVSTEPSSHLNLSHRSKKIYKMLQGKSIQRCF